jgi:lysozyme family protein
MRWIYEKKSQRLYGRCSVRNESIKVIAKAAKKVKRMKDFPAWNKWGRKKCEKE